MAQEKQQLDATDSLLMIKNSAVELGLSFGSLDSDDAHVREMSKEGSPGQIPMTDQSQVRVLGTKRDSLKRQNKRMAVLR